jgi:glycolate oxidase iron-sulfur subunit
MKGLFSHTNQATQRTLLANGYTVVRASGQRCCGALHAHAGDLDGARRLARANIVAFERSRAQFIAVNAAGCGAMMKEYGHLLADDPAWAERAATIAARVRDVSELLADAGPARAGALPARVTYDAPCHLIHGQRVVRQPHTVLESIPDLNLVPLANADHCCGSAGLYNVLQPELSQAVLARKLEHIKGTKARFVATGNPGCLMHIGAGLLRAGEKTRAVHPVDLLDAAYGGLGQG